MFHTAVVRQRATLVIAIAAAGCVGTNPDWTPPKREASGTTSDDAGAESTSAAGTTSDDEGTTDATTMSPTTAGPADDSGSTGDVDPSTSDEGPTCAAPMAFCGGICTEIWHDKHACGLDCID